MLGNESAVSKSLSHPAHLDAEKNHFSELPGTVHAQYRRRGSKVYGPYYFRFWREHGKLRKTYIGRRLLDETKARCNVRQERRRERLAHLRDLRDGSRETRQIIREIRNFGEMFALLDILEHKDEDQLTPLQRKRVQRVMTAAGIEL